MKDYTYKAIIPIDYRDNDEEAINNNEMLKNNLLLVRNKIENLIIDDEIDMTKPVVMNFTVCDTNDEENEYTGYITLDFTGKNGEEPKEVKLPFIKTNLYNKKIDKMMVQKYQQLTKDHSKIYIKLIEILKEKGFKGLYLASGSLEDLDFEVIRL